MSDSFKTYSVVGDRYRLITTGAQTGGRYAMIDAFVPSGSGSPPHMHTREDEAFYVLEGEFEFTVDGKAQRLGPGETLFAARNTPHNFKCVSATAGRMIFTVTPAGMEQFFEEVGTLLSSSDAAPVTPAPADIERLIAAAPRYGLELFPPAH